jgi:hypothetical protein
MLMRYCIVSVPVLLADAERQQQRWQALSGTIGVFWD